MDSKTLEMLAASLAPVIARFVDERLESIKASIHQPIDVDEIAKKAASLVEAVPGLPGEPGAPGKDGVDGNSASPDEVAAIFERRFSDLQLSWERQVRECIDKAIDRIPPPKDGRDGRDGIPVDGVDLSLSDDGRTVTVSMKAGETVIEKSIKIPSIIDRGGYKRESPYEKGDGVSYGGSFWIAQADVAGVLPGTSGDWRLAVKKGRDGADLRENASRHDPAKGVKIK